MKFMEREVRDWLRSEVGGEHPITWVEPSRGSTAGAADAFLAYRSRLWPIEAKVATPGLKGKIQPVVRPLQRNWHRRMAASGVETFLLIGVEVEEDKLLILVSWRWFLGVGGSIMVGGWSGMDSLTNRLDAVIKKNEVITPCLVGQIGR